MTDVIPFPSKNTTEPERTIENDPFYTEYTQHGTAVCLSCSHEWEAVAPTGVISLECPSCNTNRGVWKGLAFPESVKVWTCQCTCQYFILTQDYSVCIACGTHQTF